MGKEEGRVRDVEGNEENMIEKEGRMIEAYVRGRIGREGWESDGSAETSPHPQAFYTPSFDDLQYVKPEGERPGESSRDMQHS